MLWSSRALAHCPIFHSVTNHKPTEVLSSKDRGPGRIEIAPDLPRCTPYGTIHAGPMKDGCTMAEVKSGREGGPDNPIALNLSRIVFRLLMSPRGWQVEQMKDELGIADRTYRKYRGLLRDYFEPFFDRAGRSLITEINDGDVAYLRIVERDEPIEESAGFYAQILAMTMARQAFQFVSDTPLGKHLLAFEDELKRRIGDRPFVYRHLLNNIDRVLYTVPDAPKDYRAHSKKIDMIVRALFNLRRIDMSYEAANGGVKDHIIEPLTLVTWRSALYLIARYGPQGHRYIFAIDRIRDLRLLPDQFHYPTKTEYTPQKVLEGAWGVFFNESATPVRVELIFANVRWLKMYIRERQWHPTQKIEDLSDGRLNMTFTVTTMTEVWPWIRMFGNEVEVIYPKSNPEPDPG